MPPVLRAEKSTVLWSLQGDGTNRSFTTPPNKRFGVLEQFTPPHPTVELDPVYQIGSNTRNRSGILPQRESLRGGVPDIRIQASNDSFGAMALPMGRIQTSGGSQFIFEGVTSTDDRTPWFTLGQVNRDTSGAVALTQIFHGCKVNRATYYAREGEELRMSLDEILALDMHVPTLGWDQTTVWNPFVSMGADPGPINAGRFQFNMASVTVFGVTLEHVRGFSLSVDNQLQPRHYFTKTLSRALRPSDILDGRRAYRLQIDMDVSDVSTDVEMLKSLVNHGMAQSDERVRGGSISIAFDQAAQVGLEGETGRLFIACDPNPTNASPGSVIQSGPVSLPGPPAGVPSTSLVIDVGAVAMIINPDL